MHGYVRNISLTKTEDLGYDSKDRVKKIREKRKRTERGDTEGQKENVHPNATPRVQKEKKPPYRRRRLNYPGEQQENISHEMNDLTDSDDATKFDTAIKEDAHIEAGIDIQQSADEINNPSATEDDLDFLDHQQFTFTPSDSSKSNCIDQFVYQFSLIVFFLFSI